MPPELQSPCHDKPAELLRLSARSGGGHHRDKENAEPRAPRRIYSGSIPRGTLCSISQGRQDQNEETDLQSQQGSGNLFPRSGSVFLLYGVTGRERLAQKTGERALSGECQAITLSDPCQPQDTSLPPAAGTRGSPTAGPAPHDAGVFRKYSVTHRLETVVTGAARVAAQEHAYMAARLDRRPSARAGKDVRPPHHFIEIPTYDRQGNHQSEASTGGSHSGTARPSGAIQPAPSRFLSEPITLFARRSALAASLVA